MTSSSVVMSPPVSAHVPARRGRPVAAIVLAMVMLGVPRAGAGQDAAIRFDGTNDRVTFGRGATLAAHTIEAWVRPSGQRETGIIAGQIGDPGAVCTQGFALSIDAANRLGYVVGRSGCGNDAALYTPIPADLGVWTHLAGTYDGAGVMRLYVNGLLVLEKSGVAFNPSSWMTAGAFDLAGYPASGRLHYAGDLDVLRIWNHARTSAQLAAGMFQSVTGGEAGLVGAWTFDEGTGQIVTDASPSARRGTFGVNGSIADASDPAWVTPGVPLLSSFRIDALSTAAGGDDGPVSIRVFGNGFTSAAVAQLTSPLLPAATAVRIVASADGRSARVTFHFAGQPHGTYRLVITNPDGRTATAPEEFLVTTRAPADVWVDIVGRPAFRLGREEAVRVRVGNSSNVDANDFVAWIRIPQNTRYRISEPLPSIPGVDWAQIPQGVDVGQDVLIPIWLPTVDAGSVREIPLLLTFPSPAWSAGAQFSVRVDAFQADSDLARSGDPADVSTSPTFANVLTSFGTTVCGGAVTPVPAFCADATSDPPYGTFFSSLRKHASELLVGALVTTFVAIAIPALVEAGASTLIITAAVTGLGLFSAWSTFDAQTKLLSFIPRAFDEMSGRLVASWDPNEKAGPSGVSVQRFIRGNEELEYVVFFENLAAATAAAQEIVVTDQLDTTIVDVQTFGLGPLTIGSRLITPPAGRQSFVTQLDLRPAADLLINVDARLDELAGAVSWRFTAVDPATGTFPDDPLLGVLPPNVRPPEGDGSVRFSIKLRPGVVHRTAVRNTAAITFDTNPAIITNEWLNTVDRVPPSSAVEGLPATQSSRTFPVSWGGTDDDAGLASFDILVSVDGAEYTSFLTATSLTAATFTGELGHTYRFYSVARDAVGNLEGSPPEPDAVTQLVAPAEDMANLRVSALQGKAVAGAGLSYAARDTTRNAGTATAAASITAFYLSTDAVLDASDRPLAPLTGRAVVPLPVGATSIGTTQLTIPVNASAGKWYLIARADADDRIVESTEMDNVRARVLYIGPDLNVASLAAPAVAIRGQTISIMESTRNIGGASTQAQTITQFYLSVDRRPSALDIRLGPGRTVPLLVPGAASVTTTSVDLPADVAPRAYYLLAVADSTSLEEESRETNNVRALPITVQ